MRESPPDFVVLEMIVGLQQHLFFISVYNVLFCLDQAANAVGIRGFRENSSLPENRLGFAQK